MTESRTKRSLHNSYVAMTFFIVEMGLRFFSRKIFLEYLGTEILGLNTTAYNILDFLNLAELGIGAAVGFSLYKPIYENDRQSITEIIALQGHLYRRIASWIVVGAVVVMCFFPLIFKKMDLPLWYAYASFGVLLLSSLVGYYFNYKQIILSASQQDYKITYATKTWSIIQVLCQIAAMIWLDNPYFWWLFFQGFFSLIKAWNLSMTVKKNYPWLQSVSVNYSSLRKKYADIFQKIRQVFVHRIGAFALTQTPPLIIYALISLTAVTMYSNYTIIAFAIQTLCNAVFNSIGAGIGNLVAEAKQEKIWQVFRELFSVRFYIAAIITWGFTTLSQPFVSLWIGPAYNISNVTVILIGVQLFLSIFRQANDNFINAYGLYSDIWAPIVEAVLNVGLSVLFGIWWGLNGIILGVIVTMTIIVLLWKPYFLFSRGIKVSIRKYIVLFMSHLILLIISIFIMHFFLRYMSNIESWNDLIMAGIIDIVLFSTLYGGLLYFTKSGFDDFIVRVIRLNIREDKK